MHQNKRHESAFCFGSFVKLLEIVKEGYLTYQLPLSKLKRGKINILTVRLIPNPETQGLKAAS